MASISPRPQWVKPLLKSGHGWIATYHIWLLVWFLIHVIISDHVNKRALLYYTKLQTISVKINSLTPGDARWCHRTWPTLVCMMPGGNKPLLEIILIFHPCGHAVHMRAISHNWLDISIIKICLKITNWFNIVAIIAMDQKVKAFNE